MTTPETDPKDRRIAELEEQLAHLAGAMKDNWVLMMRHREEALVLRALVDRLTSQSASSSYEEPSSLQ